MLSNIIGSCLLPLDFDHANTFTQRIFLLDKMAVYVLHESLPEHHYHNNDFDTY